MVFTFAQILSLTLTNLIQYAVLGVFLIIVGKLLIRTWFTEKEKDGNSSLYSLIDFKGLNKLSSIHRAYMNGQFGALPNVIM